MIGRSLWFVAGAAAGVYGTVRARRAAETFTAEGLRHRAKAASLGARMVREEIAQGQAEAEAELRERHRLAVENHRALQAPDAPESNDSTRQIPPQEDSD